MKYHGTAWRVLMPVFAAVLAACGGGGGSGGGSSPQPDVRLPDITSATQKTLTTANSKQALMLTLEVLELVEQSALEIEPAVDVVNARAPSRSVAERTARRVASVSSGMCRAGNAEISSNSRSDIGVHTIRFTDCVVDGAETYNGTLIIDQRDHATDYGPTDATLTFDALRITSLHDDFVLDGRIDVAVAYVHGGQGRLSADVDISDLRAGQGIRVRGYVTDFSIQIPDLVFQYTVTHREGRIYDSSGEYFDIGVVPGAAPWPQLTGSDSHLTVVPSGLDAPYRQRIVLESNAARHLLLADLQALSVHSNNDYAPEFISGNTATTIDKNRAEVIPIFDVIDRDQQFVRVNWQPIEVPDGAIPLVEVSDTGLVFSSSTGGDYTYLLSASDGRRSTDRTVLVHVRYDAPAAVIAGPDRVGSDSSANLDLNFLSAEGTIETRPITPGLVYGPAASSTYSPLIPAFDSEQEINLLLRVSNEDHSVLVARPITVMPATTSYPELVPVSRWANPAVGWLGYFRNADIMDVASTYESSLSIFGLGGGSPSLDSYVPYSQSAGRLMSSLAILDVADLDADGIDELILAQNDGAGVVHLGIFDARSQRLDHDVEIAAGSQFSAKAEVTDLNNDGQLEVVFFTGESVFAFDASLELVWRSEPGEYGRHFQIVNVDADNAQEIITDRGYIFDGVSAAVQQQGYEDIGAQQLFVVSDGQGTAVDILVVAQEGSADPALLRITDSGYVSQRHNFYIQSNALTHNVDSDAEEEIVFVANYDATNPSSPFGLGVGVLSLIYLDSSNDSFEIRLLTVLDDYSPGHFELSLQDIDRDGNAEYLVLSTGDDTSIGSFVYHPETQQVGGYIDPVVAPLALRSQVSGGALAASLEDKLVFCGLYAHSEGDDQDLLVFDPQSNLFDTPFSWVTGKTVENRFYDANRCLLATAPSSGQEYVVSLRSDATFTPQYRNYNEISIQQLPSGNIIFHKIVDVSSEVERGDVMPFAVDDFDADGDLDIAYASDRQHLQVFDISSGIEIASYTVPQREYISKVIVGRHTTTDAMPNVFVMLLEQVATLRITSSGDLQQTASAAYSRGMHIIDAYTADVDGTPGDELIAVTSTSPSQETDFRIYDMALNEVATWDAPSQVGVVTPLRIGASEVVVTAEYEDEFAAIKDWRVVWREPLTGTVIYRSPLINYAGDITDLNFFIDNGSASLRMVVTAEHGVVITP